MPRANIEKHLAEQSGWGAELLKTPAGRRAVRIVKRAADSSGQVPTRVLAALTGVATAAFGEKQDSNTPRQRKIHLPQALEAIRDYLPRVLRWKSLAAFSKELGLHRNQVEKLVRDSGTRSMLMYARDKRIYISPAGEAVARDRAQE